MKWLKQLHYVNVSVEVNTVNNVDLDQTVPVPDLGLYCLSKILLNISADDKTRCIVAVIGALRDAK